MPNKRPSLTYTPLNVKVIRHHGPPDPDANSQIAGFSQYLPSPSAVVTGRGGGTTTACRKRKKGYAKTVSEKRELRRERRHTKSRSSHGGSGKTGGEEDIIDFGADDLNKENTVLKSNVRRKSELDDEEISSPEKEIKRKAKGGSEDEMDVEGGEDSDATQSLSNDEDDFGGTEYHVDEEEAAEDDASTVMGDESGNKSDASGHVPKRLFPTTAKKLSGKKRRVIQEEEEEEEEDATQDSTQDSSASTGLDTACSNPKSKAGRASKATESKANSNARRGKNVFNDEDSSDDDVSVGASTNDANDGIATGGSRRRSSRLERGKEDPHFSACKSNVDMESDEDSENEFLTLTSADNDCKKKAKKQSNKTDHFKVSSKSKKSMSLANKKLKGTFSEDADSSDDESITPTVSKKKKKKASSTSNKASSKSKKSSSAKDTTSVGKMDGNANDDSSDDESFIKKKKTSQSSKSKKGKKEGTEQVVANNATKAKSSKSKSAKQALPKSVPSKKTAYSGNSFVQAALAKYEATESVASNIAESKKNSRKKKSEKSKDVSKKKTKVDEFDFEDVEDSSSEAGSDDEASEYEPTQGEGKKMKVADSHSPRPTRRTSSRTNKGKSNANAAQPSAEDQEGKTAPVVAPRRRKKNAASAKKASKSTSRQLDECEGEESTLADDEASTAGKGRKKAMSKVKRGKKHNVTEESIDAAEEMHPATRNGRRKKAKSSKDCSDNSKKMECGMDEGTLHDDEAVDTKVACSKTTKEVETKAAVDKEEEEVATMDLEEDASSNEGSKVSFQHDNAVLEVEYDEPEIEDDDAVMNDDMPFTQMQSQYEMSQYKMSQYPSQYMEQSYGTSTEGAGGGQNGEEASRAAEHTERVAGKDLDTTKLKSVEMNTRTLPRGRVQSQTTEYSEGTKSYSDVGKLKSCDLYSNTTRGDGNESVRSSKTAQTEDTKTPNINNVCTAVEMTTRPLLDSMNRQALLAALQTQATNMTSQVQDHTQQSSTISPDTKSSMLASSSYVDGGGNDNGTTNNNAQLKLQITHAEKAAQEMKAASDMMIEAVKRFAEAGTTLTNILSRNHGDNA